jgi:hypothetical protein
MLSCTETSIIWTVGKVRWQGLIKEAYEHHTKAENTKAEWVCLSRLEVKTMGIPIPDEWNLVHEGWVP